MKEKNAGCGISQVIVLDQKTHHIKEEEEEEESKVNFKDGNKIQVNTKRLFPLFL